MFFRPKRNTISELCGKTSPCHTLIPKPSVFIAQLCYICRRHSALRLQRGRLCDDLLGAAAEVTQRPWKRRDRKRSIHNRLGWSKKALKNRSQAQDRILFMLFNCFLQARKLKPHQSQVTTGVFLRRRQVKIQWISKGLRKNCYTWSPVHFLLSLISDPNRSTIEEPSPMISCPGRFRSLSVSPVVRPVGRFGGVP